MTSPVRGFAGRIVRWQQVHGRSGLPWQATRDPYCVWLSEIMLQQTQVATVLAYYERLLARFPDVRSLASAHEDEVLSLWSGLGYYSRARNLHRCAVEVVARFGGEFPRTATQLESLPGIGKSTAAAIASFCFGERAAILDGNVKRVLSRVLAFDGSERELWAHATALLPTRDLTQTMPRYTQGLMDLGATICLPRNPSCMLCPVRESCEAAKQGETERYPAKKPKLRRTAQSLWLLRAHSSDGAVWLQKRPARGVWAGLYCLPAFDSREELGDALPSKARACDAEPFKHVLTHRDLHLHPVDVQLPRSHRLPVEGAWLAEREWRSLGLPTPIRKLLESC